MTVEATMKILLVEPDISTSQSVEILLYKGFHLVDSVNCAEDGLELAYKNSYDIIILALILPDIDGFEVIHHLYRNRVNVPILIVSGLHDMKFVVKALEIGADDYLTKPFHKDELLARVNAIVRRSCGYASSQIKLGNLEFNLEEKSLYISGTQVYLTRTQYLIFESLVLRGGDTVTSKEIAQLLPKNSNSWVSTIKNLNVHMHNIRKIIAKVSDEKFIKTVWGQGYSLNIP